MVEDFFTTFFMKNSFNKMNTSIIVCYDFPIVTIHFIGI